MTILNGSSLKFFVDTANRLLTSLTKFGALPTIIQIPNLISRIRAVFTLVIAGIKNIANKINSASMQAQNNMLNNSKWSEIGTKIGEAIAKGISGGAIGQAVENEVVNGATQGTSRAQNPPSNTSGSAFSKRAQSTFLKGIIARTAADYGDFKAQQSIDNYIKNQVTHYTSEFHKAEQEYNRNNAIIASTKNPKDKSAAQDAAKQANANMLLYKGYIDNPSTIPITQDERDKAQQAKQKALAEQKKQYNAGAAAMAVGTGIQLAGSLFVDQNTESGYNLSNGMQLTGGLVSAAGQAAMGNYVGAAMTAVTSVIQGIYAFTKREEERIKRNKENADKQKTEAANAKQEFNTVDQIAAKYEMLKEQRNESAESYQKWIDYNNEIAEQYPQLISYIDEEGNAIIRLGAAYEQLYKQKLLESNKEQMESIQADLKVQADQIQTAYTAVTTAKGAINDDITNSTLFSSELTDVLRILNNTYAKSYSDTDKGTPGLYSFTSDYQTMFISDGNTTYPIHYADEDSQIEGALDLSTYFQTHNAYDASAYFANLLGANESLKAKYTTDGVLNEAAWVADVVKTKLDEIAGKMKSATSGTADYNQALEEYQSIMVGLAVMYGYAENGVSSLISAELTLANVRAGAGQYAKSAIKTQAQNQLLLNGIKSTDDAYLILSSLAETIGYNNVKNDALAGYNNGTYTSVADGIVSILGEEGNIAKYGNAALGMANTLKPQLNNLSSSTLDILKDLEGSILTLSQEDLDAAINELTAKGINTTVITAIKDQINDITDESYQRIGEVMGLTLEEVSQYDPTKHGNKSYTEYVQSMLQTQFGQSLIDELKKMSLEETESFANAFKKAGQIVTDNGVTSAVGAAAQARQNNAAQILANINSINNSEARAQLREDYNTFLASGSQLDWQKLLVDAKKYGVTQEQLEKDIKKITTQTFDNLNTISNTVLDNITTVSESLESFAKKLTSGFSMSEAQALFNKIKALDPNLTWDEAFTFTNDGLILLKDTSLGVRAYASELQGQVAIWEELLKSDNLPDNFANLLWSEYKNIDFNNITEDQKAKYIAKISKDFKITAEAATAMYDEMADYAATTDDGTIDTDGFTDAMTNFWTTMQQQANMAQETIDYMTRQLLVSSAFADYKRANNIDVNTSFKAMTADGITLDSLEKVFSDKGIMGLITGEDNKIDQTKVTKLVKQSRATMDAYGNFVFKSFQDYYNFIDTLLKKSSAYTDDRGNLNAQGQQILSDLIGNYAKSALEAIGKMNDTIIKAFSTSADASAIDSFYETFVKNSGMSLSDFYTNYVVLLSDGTARFTDDVLKQLINGSGELIACMKAEYEKYGGNEWDAYLASIQAEYKNALSEERKSSASSISMLDTSFATIQSLQKAYGAELSGGIADTAKERFKQAVAILKAVAEDTTYTYGEDAVQDAKQALQDLYTTVFDNFTQQVESFTSNQSKGWSFQNMQEIAELLDTKISDLFQFNPDSGLIELTNFNASLDELANYYYQYYFNLTEDSTMAAEYTQKKILEAKQDNAFTQYKKGLTKVSSVSTLTSSLTVDNFKASLEQYMPNIIPTAEGGWTELLDYMSETYGLVFDEFGNSIITNSEKYLNFVKQMYSENEASQAAITLTKNEETKIKKIRELAVKSIFSADDVEILYKYYGASSGKSQTKWMEENAITFNDTANGYIINNIEQLMKNADDELIIALQSEASNSNIQSAIEGVTTSAAIELQAALGREYQLMFNTYSGKWMLGVKDLSKIYKNSNTSTETKVKIKDQFKSILEGFSFGQFFDPQNMQTLAENLVTLGVSIDKIDEFLSDGIIDFEEVQSILADAQLIEKGESFIDVARKYNLSLEDYINNAVYSPQELFTSLGSSLEKLTDSEYDAFIKKEQDYAQSFISMMKGTGTRAQARQMSGLGASFEASASGIGFIQEDMMKALIELRKTDQLAYEQVMQEIYSTPTLLNETFLTVKDINTRALDVTKQITAENAKLAELTAEDNKAQQDKIEALQQELIILQQMTLEMSMQTNESQFSFLKDTKSGNLANFATWAADVNKAANALVNDKEVDTTSFLGLINTVWKDAPEKVSAGMKAWRDAVEQGRNVKFSDLTTYGLNPDELKQSTTDYLHEFAATQVDILDSQIKFLKGIQAIQDADFEKGGSATGFSDWIEKLGLTTDQIATIGKVEVEYGGKKYPLTEKGISDLAAAIGTSVDKLIPQLNTIFSNATKEQDWDIESGIKLWADTDGTLSYHIKTETSVKIPDVQTSVNSLVTGQNTANTWLQGIYENTGGSTGVSTEDGIEWTYADLYDKYSQFVSTHEISIDDWYKANPNWKPSGAKGEQDYSWIPVYQQLRYTDPFVKQFEEYAKTPNASNPFTNLNVASPKGSSLIIPESTDIEVDGETTINVTGPTNINQAESTGGEGSEPQEEAADEVDVNTDETTITAETVVLEGADEAAKNILDYKLTKSTMPQPNVSNTNENSLANANQSDLTSYENDLKQWKQQIENKYSNTKSPYEYIQGITNAQDFRDIVDYFKTFRDDLYQNNPEQYQQMLNGITEVALKFNTSAEELGINTSDSTKKINDGVKVANVSLRTLAASANAAATELGKIQVSSSSTTKSTSGDSVTSTATKTIEKKQMSALATGTLMGELGPEAWVSNGQYHVAGTNGPEIVNLPDDAIVFNHIQTASLMSHGSANGRGRAIKNEYVAAGMARAYGTLSSNGGYAHASISDTIKTLESLKALWEDVLGKTVSDFASANSSGGSNSVTANIQDLQEWYNLLRRITQLETDINNLVAERENITDGHEYLNSLREQTNLLEEQLGTQKQLYQYQQAQLALQARQIRENKIWSQFLTVDETGLLQYIKGNEQNGGKGALQVLQELNAMSGADQIAYLNKLGYSYTDTDGKALTGTDLVKKFYEEMQDQIDSYDELYDTVHETEKTLSTLEKSLNDIENDIRKNQETLEKTIYDLIVDESKEQIDQIKNQTEVIKDANKNYIQGLTDALNREKEIYNANQSTADREQLQRQLSLLRRAGGSDTEIADLEKELNSTLKDEYFEHQQNAIDAIQEASEKQIEALNRQVTLMEQQLEYDKQNGIIWTKVYEALAGSDSEILAFMQGKAGAVDFFQKSNLQQEDMLIEWAKLVGIYNEEKVYQNNKSTATDEFEQYAFSNNTSGTNTNELATFFSQLSADDKNSFIEHYANNYAAAMAKGATAETARANASSEFLNHLSTEKATRENYAATIAADLNASKSGTTSTSGNTNKQTYTIRASASNCTIYIGAKNYTTAAIYNQGETCSFKVTAKNGCILGKIQYPGGVINAIGKIEASGQFKVTSNGTIKASGYFNKDDTATTTPLIKGATGTYTGNQEGLMYVHKKERLLSAAQTKSFEQLVDSITGSSPLMNFVRNATNSITATTAGLGQNIQEQDNSVTIAPNAITINVAKVADDYDVENIANQVFDKITTIASKAGSRGVTRR